MQTAAIQFEKVSKSFGEESILNDLDLDIQAGEFISIVGPSGCGKSTLLRLIAGLEIPDSGKLVLTSATSGKQKGNSENEDAIHSELSKPDAASVSDCPTSAQQSIGFVFQESNLLPWLNSFDNVALPFRIKGQNVDPERIMDLLHLVGLNEESYGKYPSQLSGGMKMRISIARALALEPSVLLLDEPFAALDDLLRTSLNQQLMEIWIRRRQTILFVTHNIAEAVFISQKILVLGKGAVAPRLLNVGLPYPRKTDIKSSREFADHFANVSSVLQKVAAGPKEVTT